MSTPVSSHCTCTGSQNSTCFFHGEGATPHPLITKARIEQNLADERKKLAEPAPGFSDDRGDMVDPELRAAFDHGFRIGIETAMKLYGGK